eukprot:COSAG01_NODE_17597_length_1132_cov_1.461983_2_plen_198_part_00
MLVTIVASLRGTGMHASRGAVDTYVVPTPAHLGDSSTEMATGDGTQVGQVPMPSFMLLACACELCVAERCPPDAMWWLGCDATVVQVLATLNLVYLASHGGADTNSRGQCLAHIAEHCVLCCLLAVLCVRCCCLMPRALLRRTVATPPVRRCDQSGGDAETAVASWTQRRAGARHSNMQADLAADTGAGGDDGIEKM